MAFRLYILGLILVIGGQAIIAVTVKEYLTRNEEAMVPARLRGIVRYVITKSDQDKVDNEYQMPDHTREVAEELLSYCPRSNKHLLENESILGWMLHQELKDDFLQDGLTEAMSSGRRNSLYTDGVLASGSDNGTSLCQVDLDSLLAVVYEFFDPKVSLYREASLVKFAFHNYPLTVEPGDYLRSVCDSSIKKLQADKKKTKAPEKSFPSWGWSFLDAMAKPPTAILGGQLQWVGGYEMCHKIKVTNISDDGYNSTRSFNGKYCRVMIGDKNNSLPVSFGFGLCLPDTCTTDGSLEYIRANPGLINTVLGVVGMEVKSIFCGNQLDFSTDSRAQLAVGILLTLVIVVLLATVYDLAIRPIIINSWAPEDSYHATIQGMTYSASNTDLQMMGNGRIPVVNGHVSSPDLKGVDRQSSVLSTKSLLAGGGSSDTDDSLDERPGFLERMEAAFAGFSAAASFRKLFDVKNLGLHHMPCVDGLRFLSVVYAIGGNTCLFGILYTESITASNLVDKLLELPHMFAFQPVINYSFSADTFLVVSGTVISYHWLRRLHKNGGKLGFKQIVHYYLHRYWSLMPVMMLTIMTYTCLYKYLLSGPISPPQITDAENCRTNWWANLLMLGNLVNTDTSCLAWTWFAPLLFQLQIVTPIILIPLSYKRWAGWISLGAMYMIFIATVSGIVKTQIYGDVGAWYSDYIQTPWCRAGPYLIGVAVGVLLYDKIPHRIPKNIFTKLLSWALWVVAVGLILLCTFITYTKYRKEDPVKWTEDQTVTYHVFIRSVWGLAIGYMILACQTGFGGFFNSTLSHPSFTPASRLAYPVFVVHAIFIFKYAYSQFDTIYINFDNLLYIFFGHLIMVYLIGMVIAILFFCPFQGLEYAFFGAKTKLDIITAASCEQTFRGLKTQREQRGEEMEARELEDLSATNGHAVSFM